MKEKELWLAIQENDCPAALKIINNRDMNQLNVNYIKDDGHGDGTPLLVYAINCGSIRIANALIKAGANVNFGNDRSPDDKFRSYTPLNCAIEAEIGAQCSKYHYMAEKYTPEDKNAADGLVARLFEKGVDLVSHDQYKMSAVEKLLNYWTSDLSGENGLNKFQDLLKLLIDNGATSENSLCDIKWKMIFEREVFNLKFKQEQKARGILENRIKILEDAVFRGKLDDNALSTHDSLPTQHAVQDSERASIIPSFENGERKRSDDEDPNIRPKKIQRI